MRWRFQKTDARAAGALSRALGIGAILSEMLVRRGLTDPETAEAFLKPSLKDLPDPFLLPDMEPAVHRLIQALDRREKVTIYGDYDADGLTATALLSDFLESLGASVSTYIPHRIKEGYGLNVPAVESLAASGTRLIVTVDCGVSDFEAVSRARELGMEVIVTDHHQIPPRLPPALAVLNPQRSDSDFPQRNLAGVGVAFFLAGGLRRTLHDRGAFHNGTRPELAQLLGLTAIGTVADVMPLKKINRILVSMGLNDLAQSDRPGLVALKEIGAISHDRPLTAQDVAYRLAPRLNAVGRLGSPQPGLDLLRSRDPNGARSHAALLELANKERRALQDRTVRQAEAMLENIDLSGLRSIVLLHEDWLSGIVGLAASKLTERHQRPAILLAMENGLAKGSGRSIQGFNLFRALTACEDLMIRFGGHAQAAGLTLDPDMVPDLAKTLAAIAANEISEPDLEPVLDIEAEVGIEDLPSLVSIIPALEPFGQGNPEPVFAIHHLNVSAAGCVGKNGAHLKLTLSKNGRTLSTIGFGLGHLLPDLGPNVSVALRQHTSSYQGRTAQGWKVLDVKRVPSGP